ncbi:MULTISPECIES: outer membrane protein assembly factor BamD [Flavobacterium]|uniref:outer membrane protein assembly factor BamD n=1 Tax=Flavobacterium TaxID=237 RepID=UPI00086D5659|nr:MULTISPECIES: outer membrane protein assembly factor BamD [Flavobacterium]MBN9282974.1 outer membrane protein assembly factor BamD [Flavobacterium sp.]ODS83485.1 MAG: outer membrane protein assembly factor BamD [Chryseobacterium sp. SCN 40-13]OJV67608.1 MAG: outer membrane protein assembly factor BamD [Flavobacterium sp. 40-81]
MSKFLYIFLFAVLLTSCSQYQKALKSEDLAMKYEVATKMYEAGKYSKAIRLFEQIAAPNRGKPQAEKLFYMFAQSYYKTKQYYLSGYQFESFVAGYPKSEKREEAAFLGAKSFYQLSPIYSIDQTDTQKGIDKLQDYINTYPDSPNFAEANKMVTELREKLEKKAFEIAKQYNTIGEWTRDYNAAIKALDNFITDHPGTIYKEDALFYKFDASYKLGINSIKPKMEERLNNAKVAYTALIRFKGDTKYKAKADEMLANIDKELQQFSKQ